MFLASDQKTFLFFRATFKQLSIQKATFDCFLSNFWATCGKLALNWAQSMAIFYTVFPSRCLFGVVFLHKAKQGRWLSAVSQISPASKNRAPIHHESAKFLRPGQSLISSPRHGYCDAFFGVFVSFWFWTIWFALRNLDDYVLCGEREHFLHAHPSKHRSRAISRLSEGKKIHVLSHSVLVYTHSVILVI